MVLMTFSMQIGHNLVFATHLSQHIFIEYKVIYYPNTLPAPLYYRIVPVTEQGSQYGG